MHKGGKAADLTDQIFGLLTAKYIDHRARASIYWFCECACGNTSIVTNSALLGGGTKSCGCSKRSQEVKDKRKATRNAKLTPLTTPIKQCENCRWWKALSGCENDGMACLYNYHTNKARKRTPDGTCLSRRPKAHGTQQSYDDLMRSME